MDGDVDFLREALRVLVEGSWMRRCHRGSVLSMENAALSGRPSATGIGPGRGIPV